MSFEIEMFDIEQRDQRRDRAEMDAYTSFELEAQRRQEVLRIDRPPRPESAATPAEGVHIARVAAPLAAPVAQRSPRLTGRITSAGDCQPAPATR